MPAQPPPQLSAPFELLFGSVSGGAGASPLGIDGLGFDGLAAAQALAQVDGAGLEGAGGFGWLLLKTALILLAVCVLAYVAIRFGLARLVSPAARAGDRLAVIERLGLESRRSLQVVRVGDRVLLIGVGEGGIALLAELEPEEWLTGDEKAARGAFKRALQRALGGESAAPRGSSSGEGR